MMTPNMLKDIKRQSRLITYSWVLLVLIFLLGIPDYSFLNMVSWGGVFVILYLGIEINQLFSDTASKRKDRFYNLRRYTYWPPFLLAFIAKGVMY